MELYAILQQKLYTAISSNINHNIWKQYSYLIFSGAVLLECCTISCRICVFYIKHVDAYNVFIYSLHTQYEIFIVVQELILSWY